MKDNIQQIQEGMLHVGYLCTEETATVLFLAQALNKPILVEGPAGVGKTSIAQAFASMQGLELLRLQCYEGIDEARALYEWNYKKQLLHIQAIGNQSLDVDEIEKQIFSEEYLLPRPLLKAITNEDKVCLLIDEIDKVDFEFEAMLLELLSEYQVTVPEFGTIRSKQIPAVFLTSNATRELSEALKRRCLYIYLDFPSPEVEQTILTLRIPNLSAELSAQLVEALTKIRKLKLRKYPSIAESIDWGMALLAMGRTNVDEQFILETLNVLLKYQEDMNKAKAIFTNAG